MIRLYKDIYLYIEIYMSLSDISLYTLRDRYSLKWLHRPTTMTLAERSPSAGERDPSRGAPLRSVDPAEWGGGGHLLYPPPILKV